MPRKAKGPHLYLKRSGPKSFWYIRDHKARISTGYPEQNRAAADKALEDYCRASAPSLIFSTSTISETAQSSRNTR